MKVRLFFLAFSLPIIMSLHAQNLAVPAIYEDATAMAARYQLDDQQIDKLADIITTRNNNLAAIEDLRNTDGPTYWQKRKAIYTGQQASVKRMLKNREQERLFGEQHTANRIAESKLLREMLQAGHSRETAKLLAWQQLY